MRAMSLLLPSAAPTIPRFAGTLIGPDDEATSRAPRPQPDDRPPAGADRAVRVGPGRRRRARLRAAPRSWRSRCAPARTPSPGFATTEGGLVIDLRPLKAIHVDPVRRIAWVQPGVLWGELDAATQEHGLAVTGGRASSTGVAGFTLGSGSGWLERKMGLAADNLRAARVLTADGRVVTASETRTPTCSGRCAAAAATSASWSSSSSRCAPVGPIVLGGMLMWPRERAARGDAHLPRPDARRARRAVRRPRADERAAAADRPESSCRGGPRSACWCSTPATPDRGAEHIAPLRALGPPRRRRAADALRALQTMLDGRRAR